MKQKAVIIRALFMQDYTAFFLNLMHLLFLGNVNYKFVIGHNNYKYYTSLQHFIFRCRFPVLQGIAA